MTLTESLLLHGGDALWIMFVPGAAIALLLCVGGVTFALLGLHSIGEQRLTFNATQTDRHEESDLASSRLPDTPAIERGRSQFRIGVVLLMLAVLFLSWCHHLGFLAL